MWSVVKDSHALRSESAQIRDNSTPIRCFVEKKNPLQNIRAYFDLRYEKK